MKRCLLAIACCFTAVITYAECTTLTGSSVEISRWYDFYTPVVEGEMDCWTVELDGEGPYLIRYNIDLDQFQAIDAVRIYEIGSNGTLQSLKTFTAVTMSGFIVTSSKKLKVEYYGYTGKLTEEYFDGFQLYFEKATHEYVTAHDYYIMGRLGVGTTNPQTTLHVNGSIYGGESFGATKLQSKIGYVTIGTPSDECMNMQLATDRSQFRFNKPILSQTGIFGSTTNSLQFSTNDSVQMTILNGNVGIGTASPTYKLDVNGTIRANEIIVNTTGADFVFAEDYQLRPLSEVKAFIQENKHLPEIKSAQEMQENGIGINELQTQLLQKIEELTLYLIQQEEIIQELRQEVEQLK